MATYQGIIAGIGDKANNINVINPQFDAKIRKFIIGKDCILDGLTISGTTLTAGSCIAEGYVGELPENVTLDTTAYVYGVFVVNHDNSILDKFYIATSPTAITLTNADILHTSGSYYLLLYKNGVRQVDNNYPENAENSDNTDHVNANGTIGANVICPTQPINDSSLKVANAQFVQNQIQNDINYGTTSINIYQDSNKTTTIGTITLLRKSKYVIGKIQLNSLTPIPSEDNPAFDTIPSGFRPTSNINVTMATYGALNSTRHFLMLTIAIDGTISRSAGYLDTNASTAFISSVTFGYETTT